MYCTGNTIDLAEGTNAEETDTDAEEGENLCEPFKIFAHAEFNIVEGTAEAVSVFSNGTVFDCQQTFGVFGCHAEKRCYNHPEQSTGTACTNRCSDTDDISGTDRCTQCGTECGEAGNFTFSAFLILKHPFQCKGKLTNLEQTEADGQKQSAGDNQYHQRYTPDKVVDYIQSLIDRSPHGIRSLSYSLLQQIFFVTTDFWPQMSF